MYDTYTCVRLVDYIYFSAIPILKIWDPLLHLQISIASLRRILIPAYGRAIVQSVLSRSISVGTVAGPGPIIIVSGSSWDG